MTKKKWSNQDKLMIVLEGMKNTVPLGELCSRHNVSQALYYQWKDRLLKDGASVFNYGGHDKEQERLRKKIQCLKGIIGDLTVELKKSEELPW